MQPRIRFACAAGMTVLLTLVGCSSSANGGGDGASNGSGPPSAGLTEAKGIVAKASTAPTTIPVTQPLPSAPPKGKTFVFLQCEQESCPLQGEGIKAAAKAIGWNVKVLNWKQADPATLVSAMRTALQYKPIAVSFAGPPQQFWSTVQPQFKAAGVAIIPSSLPTTPTGDAVVPGHAFETDADALGQLLAAQFVAHDNGQHSKALLVTVPDYAVYGPVAKKFKSEAKRLCPDCKTSELDITLSQLQSGGLNNAVVSALKSDPSIKYVVSVNGSFVDRLPQSLKAAGLDGKLQIISGKGGTLDQQNVLDGKQLSTVNSPFTMGGWQDVDIAIRTVMRLPVPAGDHRAVPVLLTKDNIGTPRESSDFPKDYADQFRKLWKVG